LRMAAILPRITCKTARLCVTALFNATTASLHSLCSSPPSYRCPRQNFPKLTLQCSIRYLSSVPDPPDYNINLTPQQLSEILEQCNIVDVRQPEELIAEGVIPGAKNIPLGELPGQIENIDSENAVFICRAGIRSLKAISLALQAGFVKPRHLEGGMLAWNDAFHSK